jgi:hypothetical protein
MHLKYEVMTTSYVLHIPTIIIVKKKLSSTFVTENITVILDQNSMKDCKNFTEIEHVFVCCCWKQMGNDSVVK